MVTLASDDPVAATLVAAIRAGDVDALQRLLDDHPGLASARIGDDKGGSRTPLRIATEWPGHFPNGAAVVATPTRAGADPNAPVEGSWHTETPLHLAASSDDVEVADALLDADADIETPGASIAGGPRLDDAVGYGQWRVARRLVERGARTRLWHAALGLMGRVEACFARTPPPAPEEVTEAFWQACHGGQRQAAAYLLGRGADLNWLAGWDGRTPLDIAREAGAEELVAWLRGQGRDRPASCADRWADRRTSRSQASVGPGVAICPQGFSRSQEEAGGA